MLADRALSFDRALAGVLLLAAIVAALTLTNGYLLRLLAIAGCYAILAIGYQRIFGELGVLSLAQGAFFAIGGYVTAIVGLRWSLDGLVLLPAAIAVAVLVSVCVAPPMLRLASHYFALASLAVAQLVLLAVVNVEDLTGGANGLSSLAPLHLAGFAIEQGKPLTITIWLLAGSCALAFWLPGPLAMLHRHVLRDAPLVAEAIGLNAARWRIAAFAFSAGCAGLAGGLYVQTTGVVAPDIAEFAIMVNALAITVIGGRGRVAGALVGAALLAFLPEALRFLGDWQLFAWGAAMLLMLLLAPRGIVGVLESIAIRGTTPVATASGLIAARSHGEMLIEGLGKNFGGVQALTDLSLTIGEREIVAIIGPNGAGKTTLLNLLSGFQKTDGGRIVWRDRDLASLPAHSRARLGIGRSFQTDQLPGDITVLDAVAAASLQSDRLTTARANAASILRRFDLAEFAGVALQDLSPATRRLVDLARALAASPRLLLLDEPTSGLSPVEREALAHALRQLRNEGLSLLLVEHDIGFILTLADRVVCLDEGKIIAQGAPRELAGRAELRRFFGRWAGRS